MTTLFADTFYFIALLSPTDAAHSKAIADHHFEQAGYTALLK
jgi:hypothetical protein